jgi:hypothetical protein
LFCKKKRIIKSKERFALDFESKRGKPNRKWMTIIKINAIHVDANEFRAFGRQKELFLRIFLPVRKFPPTNIMIIVLHAFRSKS